MKKLLLLLLLLSNSAYGAIVIRYFAVTAAGTGDGTSHANRAALLDGVGDWSSVIKLFNFSGTDGMEARIETGTYSGATQTLQSATFTNAPTAVNPLSFVGADSSGNVLPIPNPAWKSCQPPWDTSTMPTITSASNVRMFNLSTVNLHMLNLTSSASTGGPVINAIGSMDWCQVTNSASGATVSATAAGGPQSCVFKCTGSQYVTVTTAPSGYNCRFEGNLAATTGTRRGVQNSGAATTLIDCTIVNNVGEGVINTGSATNSSMTMLNCVVANNGADGIQANATAAQTTFWQAYNCMITGNTGIGINGNTNSHWVINQVRLRNNGGGNISGVGNSPIDINVTTTSGTDADEYVDVAGGDFRIKSSSVYWGKGYGVLDQTTANSSGFLIQ